MSGAPIEFYFEFNSPYGYIAACKLGDLASKHGREVDWKPILLRALFEVTGGRPLAQLPLRGDYMMHDFARSAAYHGIAYRQPDVYPFPPVAAARAVYWAKDQDPAKAGELGLALYHACSRDNVDIATPEGVAGIAANVGLDKDALLAALETDAVKNRLAREIEAALKKGVFGSPFIIVDGEGFWGADRLGMIDKRMQTGGW